MLQQQPQQDPQQQPISITIPLGGWQVVLEILNQQPYGKVAALIATIVEQANRAQMNASPPSPPMPNGGLNPYSPPNDGT